MLLVAFATHGTTLIALEMEAPAMVVANLGLYIHIPFCRKRCAYCNYVSNALDGPVPESFLKTLHREIEAFEDERRPISLFLGGGTPSLLSANALGELFELLWKRFRFDSPEISLEANADDITEEKARLWRSAGINRVSVGIQSFDDKVLRYLGRRHDAEGARRAAACIADAFDNWNMDLIYGASDLEIWTRTLETALSFDPPHMAAYALSYEPGAPLGDHAADARDEDELLALYQRAEAVLSNYVHYEISNFAKAGAACRHNLLYWRNEDYAGFGPGAYSYLRDERSCNVSELTRYIACPGAKAERCALSVREQQVETLIQRMRLREGVADADYQARFGEPMAARFARPLERLTQRGLVAYEQGRLRPTREGFYLNDEIGLALVDAL